MLAGAQVHGASRYSTNGCFMRECACFARAGVCPPPAASHAYMHARSHIHKPLTTAATSVERRLSAALATNRRRTNKLADCDKEEK